METNAIKNINLSINKDKEQSNPNNLSVISSLSDINLLTDNDLQSLASISTLSSKKKLKTNNLQISSTSTKSNSEIFNELQNTEDRLKQSKLFNKDWLKNFDKIQTENFLNHSEIDQSFLSEENLNQSLNNILKKTNSYQSSLASNSTNNFKKKSSTSLKSNSKNSSYNTNISKSVNEILSQSIKG